MKKLLITMSGILLCSSAYAEPFNGWYAGAQVGYENIRANDEFTGAGVLSGDNNSTSASLSGVNGGIYGGYGMTFNKLFYLGIEANGDLSSSDKSESDSGLTAEVKHTYSYGVSVRPGITPVDNLLIYTRLGWIQSHFEESYSGLFSGSTSATPSGIDTGLGAEYAITPQITARLDWTYAHYQDVDVTTVVNGASIGTDRYSPSSNTFRVGLAYNF